jgi:hypothetical protein
VLFLPPNLPSRHVFFYLDRQLEQQPQAFHAATRHRSPENVHQRDRPPYRHLNSQEAKAQEGSDERRIKGGLRITRENKSPSGP